MVQNILNQKRHLRDGTQIEDLTYQYNYNTNNLLIQNRLYHVNDAIGAGVDATDIDDMGAFTAGTNINTANNYSYDEEGRLTKDVQEGIDAITWRVDGKVKKIARPVGSGKKNVTFDYDAMGNRIAKHTYDDNWMLEKSTYYILDAQGNQMNIYEHEVSTENVQYNLVERNMYGSSRLGTFSEKVNMLEENTSSTQTVTLGYKYFELSNHLGNVLTVIKDIKIPIELEGDDDEPFEDPGDAPYFNANGTIKFDQLINHPSHTCVNPGLNFQDSPSSSYPTFEDVNNDGNIDMKVKSEVPFYAFPTRLFFYTTPGETYTLNYEILSWQNVNIIGVTAMQCGNLIAPQVVVNSIGVKNISFTATSDQTEIKWFIIKQQTLNPGEITFANFSFTQGTGPFFSQPLTPPVDPETDISHYEVAIVSVADYSPFGVQLDGRTMESEKYRRGFNGMEKDDDVKGKGNSYDFGARMYDSRLGRWLSRDAKEKKRAGINPYHFVYNSPIIMVDPNGEDGIITIDPVNHTVTLSTTVYLYGAVGADGTVTAENYNKVFSSLSNTRLVTDKDDPSIIWTVKIDVQYVYDEAIAASLDKGENVDIPEGSNTLRLKEGNYTDGKTCLGCNDGYSTKSPHHVFHETFHFLGFDERYIHIIVQYLGDVMSNSDQFGGKVVDLHIRGFHFADLLDFAIENYGDRETSSNVVGSRTETVMEYGEFYEYIKPDGTVGEKRDSHSIKKSHVHQIDEGAVNQKDAGVAKAESQDSRTSKP